MAYDVDRRPGAWVTKQAARRVTGVWSLVAVLIALTLACVGLLVSSAATTASSVFAIAVMFAIKRYADRAADTAARWEAGARAERAVGEELNKLRSEGFVVLHDVTQGGEGNVDHLVSGPTGVFMVETKWRGYLERDLVKAKRQAAKLQRELGVWVTPVVCIHARDGRPFRDRGVSVVPLRSLLDWIRAQRNTPLEFERLARYADTL